VWRRIVRPVVGRRWRLGRGWRRRDERIGRRHDEQRGGQQRQSGRREREHERGQQRQGRIERRGHEQQRPIVERLERLVWRDPIEQRRLERSHGQQRIERRSNQQRIEQRHDRKRFERRPEHQRVQQRRHRQQQRNGQQRIEQRSEDRRRWQQRGLRVLDRGVLREHLLRGRLDLLRHLVHADRRADRLPS